MKFDLAARGAELTPDRSALWFGDRWHDYQELNARAACLAHSLAALGVGQGDRVCTLAANHLAHFDLLLAAPKLGFIFAPLNIRLSVSELSLALQQIRPRLLFHDARSAVLAEQSFAGPRIALDSHQAWSGDDGVRESPALSPESIHMILMTGGSTGTPKAAMLPYRQIMANARATASEWGLGPEDCAIQATPCYHAALNVFSTPLLAVGGRVVLTAQFDPGEYLRLVAQHRATLMFMVPSMYRQLVEHPAFANADLSSVRWAISGGAPCPDALAKIFQRRGISFRQGYGMTEAGVNCFTQSVQEGDEYPDSVGRPMPHVQMQIRHPDGCPCAPGETGELTLSGEGLCAGYFTAESEWRDVVRDGWFWTGDLAECDAQGRYRIRGRRKDMFISGGENVFPAEVEAALLRCEGVLECAVMGVADARWGEAGLAAVVMRSDARQDAATLKQALRARLAAYKIPREIHFLDALPRNGVGKLDRRELVRLVTAEMV